MKEQNIFIKLQTNKEIYEKMINEEYLDLLYTRAGVYY